MSGLIATVLLREPYTPCVSGEVGRLLREVSPAVQESRSSYHWELTIRECFLTIDIRPTNPVYGDFDDLLVSLELDYDDVPELIEISSNSSGSFDQEHVTRLATMLAERLDGIYTGIQS